MQGLQQVLRTAELAVPKQRKCYELPIVFLRSTDTVSFLENKDKTRAEAEVSPRKVILFESLQDPLYTFLL